MMNAAQLLVKALEEEGVDHVFAVPGEENLDLLEALRESPIQLVVTRHEQGAGFMAATYGRLTGRAGVCLATLGPGATNLLTPAAYAQLGGLPLVMITGQKPIKSSKQGQFQIIDVIDMMDPVTKYTSQLTSAAVVPSRVREAFRMAEWERPGACHLELPEDVATEESDAHVLPRQDTRRPVAEDKAIARAVNLLEQAERPLLLIGAGANRKRTCAMLQHLVDKTGFRVVATQMGKGVFDERRPEYVGTASISSGDFVHRCIEAADTIVNIGHDVVEKPPFIMRRGGRQVIHINFSGAEVDPVYFPQCEVIGDVANALWHIAESIDLQSHWQNDFADFVRRTIQADIADTVAGDNECPLSPARIVHDVRQVVPDNGIVALDNGLYKIWFARNYPAYAANSLLLDNALASMGAGLPSAIAAALIYPERFILAVCGDGGFMMNSQEMETAVRLGINLTVLVLRDDAYGMIKWKQQAMQLSNFGLEFGNPDFPAYAESYGARGYRVTRADELTQLLNETLQTDGVHLIECPCSYAADADRLGQALRQRSEGLELP